MNAIGTMPKIKDQKAAAGKLWTWRGGVVLGAAVMLVSWFLPWWNFDIEELGYDMVRIRPWGLDIDKRLGSFEILLKGAPMPAWFAPMMWALLVACLLALLVGMFIGGKELRIGKITIKLSQLLVGGVGGVFILVAVVAAVYAQMRMGSMFGAALVGRTSVDLGGELHSFVETRLLPGYFLAYVAGLILLALGLLRNKITGEK